MIPPGYITLPEALNIIEACIDDDDFHVLQGLPIDKCRRYAAIAGLGEEVCEDFGGLTVFVMRGGKPSIVPRKEAQKLVEEGWRFWIEEGRVNADAFKHTDEIFGETRDRPTTEHYHGALLLVEESSVRYAWKPQTRSEPPKTGAPGRPSSMDLVMKEFGGRLSRGETATSRSAEAKELARWLADKHPDMPSCTDKTILNKLPAAFQPRNGGK